MKGSLQEGFESFVRERGFQRSVSVDVVKSKEQELPALKGIQGQVFSILKRKGQVILDGASIDEHHQLGGMMLSSFVLNMNTLFERFLERYFRDIAPVGVTVHGQDIRGDVFRFVENEADWRKPKIKPDLVFRSGGKVIAVGDAKYKDRTNHRPTTAELYQLTTYGLAYDMPEPRNVVIFYPLGAEGRARSVSLEFSPIAAKNRVLIRLVGVPIDGIVGGTVRSWWPIEG